MTSRDKVTASEALERLKQGNARFVSNVRSVDALVSQKSREALVDGQSPFAIVLSCSDSRAPSELIFDCGLGDLFVVRVAGNVAAPSIVGSVEFAAATFGTELVLVMGHTRCGAVGATVDALASGKPALSENVRDIVDRIAPGIAELVRREGRNDEVVRTAIRTNVRVAANHLRHGSRLLEDLVRSGRLKIIGAEYALETGVVDFFDSADQA
jgi:carbonic anhydrase